MRQTIFQDKTSMPPQGDTLTPVDQVTAARISTTADAGALATYRLGPEYMNVANCRRPRRGHDY